LSIIKLYYLLVYDNIVVYNIDIKLCIYNINGVFIIHYNLNLNKNNLLYYILIIITVRVKHRPINIWTECSTPPAHKIFDLNHKHD